MNGGYGYPRDVIQTCAGIIKDIIGASKPSATAYNAAGQYERICRGFDFVIKTCKVSRMANDAAYELLYPLAALADETFLNIPECRGSWSENPLQLRYFGELAAGTKFFARLDELVAGVSVDDVVSSCAGRKKEVLELYFLCLASGFKGMYCMENSGVLRNIVENLGVILIDIRSKSGASRVGKKRNPQVKAWGLKAVICVLAASIFALVTAAAAYMAAAAGLSEFLSNF